MRNTGAAASITLALLTSANLRQARIKSATGSLSVCLSPAGKPGRSATDVKGHGSDDALAGGASVVVRDGKAHYMAKGSSLNVFAT
ncbi:hypothetical protein [Escherichia coli]|uniref:hypothetical protein n=1 Tax=Escherichia coli TaxID=562 RepID=UPI001895597B|nr:hypothetical protein [Escherichia coli]